MVEQYQDGPMGAVLRRTSRIRPELPPPHRLSSSLSELSPELWGGRGGRVIVGNGQSAPRASCDLIGGRGGVSQLQPSHHFVHDGSCLQG